MSGHSYVYFMKPVGMDGPIKIGCSNAPERRLAELASWSPWPLEVVGKVPGNQRDEFFLHRCFAAFHTRHEWFLSSPLLRGAIKEIIDSGSLDSVRLRLKPTGNIHPTRMRSEEKKRYSSYNMRVVWACKKLRVENEQELIYWNPPPRVRQIMDRWGGNSYRGIVGVAPTDAELALVEEFLSDPALHGIPNQSKRIPRSAA